MRDFEKAQALWKAAGAKVDTVLELDVSELPERFKVVRATLHYLPDIKRHVISWWCDDSEKPTGFGLSEFGIETVAVEAKLLLHLQDLNKPLEVA